MLTIDNLSLGICSVLSGTSTKNTRCCSPECLETLRESKFGEVVRSRADGGAPEKAVETGPSKAWGGLGGENRGSVGSSLPVLK